MLCRSQRMLKKQFDDVLKRGRVFHSPLFIARVVFDSKSELVKVAAVAPVKIAKTAVVRNRTRRRIYEAVKTLIPEIKKGTSIILFAKQPALISEFESLKQDIKEIFVKAGVLR